jgi:2-polyprenyl-3-methyl-5-hydroxy-6-metoxy-1,4-benzoquinol methylase
MAQVGQDRIDSGNLSGGLMGTSRDVFLEHYTRQQSIERYVRNSAGAGIAYLLENVYGRIYLDIIRRLVKRDPVRRGFQVLEYGCGGGMNLLTITSLLSQMGLPLESAYGADFSPQMVDAAKREADAWAPQAFRRRITYVQARNENLAGDLAVGLSKPRSSLANSFHLIVGVNTFRFCYRLQKSQDCARDIGELLAPGGYSIMIDMNHHFPFFRSRFYDWLTKPAEERLLPALEEYAKPFEAAGLVIDEQRNFCWIPHSASRPLLFLARFLSPVLDRFATRFAMRSLVVCHKPVAQASPLKNRLDSTGE